MSLKYLFEIINKLGDKFSFTYFIIFKHKEHNILTHIGYILNLCCNLLGVDLVIGKYLQPN